MYKKLYRSNKYKMLGGVAGGIAEYFEIDPTLIRLAFVLIVFAGGAGILAYLIMWIVVPSEPFDYQRVFTTPPPASTNSDPNTVNNPEINPQDPNNLKYSTPFDSGLKKNNTGWYFGIILVVIGSFLLFENLFSWLHFHDIFPLVFIVGGIILLINAVRK